MKNLIIASLFFIPVIGNSQEKKTTIYNKKMVKKETGFFNSKNSKTEETGNFRVEESKDSSGSKILKTKEKEYKESERTIIRKSPISTVIIDFIKNESKETTIFSEPKDE